MRTLCISVLMHSREVCKVGNEKEVVEKLYRASLCMLLVNDDVSAACPAVSGKCGRIIRTVERAGVSIGLF